VAMFTRIIGAQASGLRPHILEFSPGNRVWVGYELTPIISPRRRVFSRATERARRCQRTDKSRGRLAEQKFVRAYWQSRTLAGISLCVSDDTLKCVYGEQRGERRTRHWSRVALIGGPVNLIVRREGRVEFFEPESLRLQAHSPRQCWAAMLDHSACCQWKNLFPQRQGEEGVCLECQRGGKQRPRREVTKWWAIVFRLAARSDGCRVSRMSLKPQPKKIVLFLVG